MGVSYLLDTHVVVWLIGTQRPPKATLIRRLEASDSRVLVSAMSAYELGTRPDQQEILCDQRHRTVPGPHRTQRV